MTEKSGTVYLSAGRHPLQLDWFNGTAKFGLQVNYEGPELPRQKIPDSALFRMQVNVAGDECTGSAAGNDQCDSMMDGEISLRGGGSSAASPARTMALHSVPDRSPALQRQDTKQRTLHFVVQNPG